MNNKNLILAGAAVATAAGAAWYIKRNWPNLRRKAIAKLSLAELRDNPEGVITTKKHTVKLQAA